MAAVRMAHQDYTVAWICALPIEAAAARTMLDKTHAKLPQSAGDDNSYTLGGIAGHNIVIAYLPSGVYGTASAAIVAAKMQSTFPSIRFGLMVGIGGGVPSTKNDIRLGDIVVSKPTGNIGGVVQYDYGKTVTSGVFQQTGLMNQPPPGLLNAIAQLQADQILGTQQSIMEMLSDALLLNGQTETEYPWSRPAREEDRLYDAAYPHPENEETCIKCDEKRLIQRKRQRSDEPQVHYGIIASGNQVMKDSQTRDRLAKEHGMLCFEMEAAGLMNQLQCLVIRGICDYCDSHKNKQWQGYAALTAAAYAKALLQMVPVNQLNHILQKPCWVVPFEQNRRFLGRQDEINRLEKMVFNMDGTRKAALTGLGGVGKTQIALELAYRVRKNNPKCSVFWIPSISMEAVEQAFMSMSQQLELQNVNPNNVKSRVKAYLSSDIAGSWLLIIDNADDVEMWVSYGTSSPSSLPSLRTFLPQSQHGFTLFTTRNQQLATKLVSPDIISISEMDDICAKRLLEASLVQKELLEDNDSIAALIFQLSGLPLALIQAASYINENLISLDTYLSLLHAQEGKIVELLSQNFEDDWRYTESKNPVALTWLISFHQIQKLNSLAADYLSFMSCINPRDIPQSILPQIGSQIQKQNALGLLKAYSFITEQTTGQFISLHRLVHLATRNWLREEGVFQEWVLKTGSHLNEVFPSRKPENRILWREYLPHAQFILQCSEFRQGSNDRESFAKRVGECLDSDGRYHEAENLFLQVLEVRRTVLGPEHPNTLSSIADLATTYWKQGRLREAEELGVQVLEARETVLGSIHPDTLESMSNLASTYHNQGRLKEAEELHIQVLEARKTILGSAHPDTLESMSNLASTYWYQGQLKEAEELYIQVLEARKTVLGSTHPDTLISMSNLANTYHNRGRLKEAEELDIQVLEARKTVLGSTHPDTLISMSNLANTHHNWGRLKEAEELHIQVLEARKTILGSTHPNTLESMSNLASTYHNQRRLKEAEELHIQVLEARKTILGSTHPNTLESMSDLANIYHSQGRLKEAEELYIQVLEARKTVLGLTHPNTLISMSNLANTYHNRGRLKEAEELQIQVLEARKTILGSTHPNTLESMSNLATTYHYQVRLKEAEELHIQVLEAQKTVLGSTHPDTLMSMSNLATTYHYQGRLKEAEELHIQVLEAHKIILGSTHHNTLESMSNLATTYHDQGRLKEAEELHIQVLEAHKTVLGSTHPHTLSSMWNLSHTWKNQGRHADAIELLTTCIQLQCKTLGPNHPNTIFAKGTLEHWQIKPKNRKRDTISRFFGRI